MAATEAADLSDGPVLSVINKRIRALRKKLNRISQMEESLSQGKTLNKEQQETLRSKSAVLAGIDELEKLLQPISAAVADEISLAVHRHQVSASETSVTTAAATAVADSKEEPESKSESNVQNQAESQISLVIEDLLNLLYFGSMFDVNTLQNHLREVLLSRLHERGSCLSYDYMKDDDSIDLLTEKDLDSLAMLSGLLISRPASSSLSHKNAIQSCIEHVKLWLESSDQPIEPNFDVTYAGLRLKLSKIMASQYFTAAPVGLEALEAAVMNYGSYQVPVEESGPPIDVQLQLEDSGMQCQQKEEESLVSHGHKPNDNQSSHVEELHQEEQDENLQKLPAEMEGVQSKAAEGVQDPKDLKEQQHVPQRSYQNYRGGRRPYSNRRGRGGAYQNGRGLYHDQPGGYYKRNYNYNYRGKGGSYSSNRASGDQPSYYEAS